MPTGDEWLSEGERVRLAGLRVPKRRADWRLGRWTAKCGVSAYLGLATGWEALTAVEVRPALSGAPELFLHGSPAPVALSLSHSGSIGLCAIVPGGARVGCDVETVEPRSPGFLADYFTGEEQDLMSRTPARRRDLLATLLWSAKESALKALGCGLRSDTRAVRAVPADFLEAGGDEWRGLRVEHESGRIFRGWWRLCQESAALETLLVPQRFTLHS